MRFPPFGVSLLLLRRGCWAGAAIRGACAALSLGVAGLQRLTWETIGKRGAVMNTVGAMAFGKFSRFESCALAGNRYKLCGRHAGMEKEPCV